MRQPIFSFEPFRKIVIERKSQRKKGFTINVKYGLITFPKSYIIDNVLEKKYIKWYIDVGKKALGWKILEIEKDLSSLTDYIQLKASPSNGQYKMSIRRLLKAFNFKDMNVSFKNLEYEKYIGRLEDGTIHYLLLNNPVSCDSKQQKNETTL